MRLAWSIRACKSGASMANIFSNIRRIDVYAGRIAVYCRRYWYTGWHWVYLADGYATIADWNNPNGHLGLVPLKVALDDRAREQITPHDVTASLFARFGALLTDKEVAELIDECVRLGRRHSIIDRSGEEHLRDGFTLDLNVWRDLDDRDVTAPPGSCPSMVSTIRGTDQSMPPVAVPSMGSVGP